MLHFVYIYISSYGAFTNMHQVFW